ncbi:MAG: ATP-binding protein, partial [Akkermansiaceae bacterium]|nr:ATP-binding protein [Akkermansiaceae bacterium]
MSTTAEHSPFPGLRPFHTDEDYLFFGRDAQVSRLLNRLRKNRFIAVVGTSGSGKSSLVRAGLIPSLTGGAMMQAGSSWEIALMRPGGRPIENLAQALAETELYEPDSPELVERLTASLKRSRLGLTEAKRFSDTDATTNLLLVVDQFEEVFRFVESG